ncbi:MAG: sigma 54-interacting transcriptional regulator [Chitinispirillales bacterium]|jgi:DNA-binding NtrC family response regulator|nr:sigma 54-interacting transcriptional regulator [Chitinispirillales bacterium]
MFRDDKNKNAAGVDGLPLYVSPEQERVRLEKRILVDMAVSPSMNKVLHVAKKIAPTTSTVLIGGESGTGKEFFARIIHSHSQCCDRQFVAVNCGAIPDTLFESEFFGYRKGAFTGAERDKPGLVEEAHGGTLFLDEVGELSLPAQVKLLRFLQDRMFRSVGDTSLRTADVRIIAATNKDLRELMERGEFREDLFFRLNVFYLHLPPLRERKETIPGLISLFVHRFNRILGKNVSRFSNAAESLLGAYDYPGNIRELENIIEHAVVMAEGDEITERDLPESMFCNRLLLPGPPSGFGIGKNGIATLAEVEREHIKYESRIATLPEVERKHIKYVLELTNHNQSDAAEKLGLSRSTLWRKIKEFKLPNALEDGDIKGAIEAIHQHISKYMAKISCDIIKQTEKHCETAIHEMFKMPSLDYQSEVKNADGQTDVHVKTKKFEYYFKFKLNKPAAEALAQIDTKEPGTGSGKKLFKVGISFDSEKRNIAEWSIDTKG